MFYSWLFFGLLHFINCSTNIVPNYNNYAFCFNIYFFGNEHIQMISIFFVYALTDVLNNVIYYKKAGRFITYCELTDIHRLIQRDCGLPLANPALQAKR